MTNASIANELTVCRSSKDLLVVNTEGAEYIRTLTRIDDVVESTEGLVELCRENVGIDKGGVLLVFRQVAGKNTQRAFASAPRTKSEGNRASIFCSEWDLLKVHLRFWVIPEKAFLPRPLLSWLRIWAD